MLENLEELQGLECETAAGDKSQSSFLACVVLCSVRASFWSPAFALLFLCNRPKLEGVLAERADDLLPLQPPHPHPTHLTIDKDLETSTKGGNLPCSPH